VGGTYRAGQGPRDPEPAQRGAVPAQGDDRQRLLRSLVQPRPPARSVLELQRSIGNARTARVLARKPGTQTGAAPALDERAAALEAELLDPELAPKIATLREVLNQAVKVTDAVSAATPEGKLKVPGTAHLKLVLRLWNANDPEERRKLADRLAGRPTVTVLEWIDFSLKALKETFDVFVEFAKLGAKLGRHADALATLARIERLGKVASWLGVAADAFGALYGVIKLLDSAEKSGERLSGGVSAVAGGAKLAGTAGAARVGGRLAAEAGAKGSGAALAWAPAWAVRLTAIGTAVEIAYLQQEILAGLYSDAMTGTAAPSVEREYRQLADAMREVARARVLTQHVYEHWARAQEKQDELAEAIEYEFHDALRAYHSAVNAALAAFDRLRYRAMKKPYLARLGELAKLAEIAAADPASGALAVFAALEELAAGLYGIAADLFKDKEKMVKKAAIENADRFHGREVE
jgi:hypothetical protein